MPVIIKNGNIFSSKAKVIVNTINCVGVMGAGIALECRLRYPDMYQKYIQICDDDLLKPGMLWIYKAEQRWVLNFPTKKHWKDPSKESYLRSGLSKFVATYKSRGVKSIAFPLLGADKGGIDKNISLSIMKEYLSDLDIDVEIYEYNQCAYDDIYQKLEKWLLSEDILTISEVTKIRKSSLEKIINAMKDKGIYQVNQLAGIKGVGISTLEKLFASSPCKEAQASLF